HCGLLPLVVREGFTGPIRATPATIDLARLVLLDSGRLQEEFAKREARWEQRHPERAEAEDRREQDALAAAMEEAAEGEAIGGAVLAAPPGGNAGTGEAGGSAPGGRASTSSGTGAGGEGVWDRAVLPGGHDPEEALRGQPAVFETLDEPLYTERDAEIALGRFRPIDYDREEEIAPGVFATFVDAGHILGSAIIRLRVEDPPGSAPVTIVFSGDLGRPGTPILRDPTRLADADYVLVESTYGGREHEPEAEAVRLLAEAVRLVAEADGVLLVPAFAIGRTQEIVWELDRLVAAGEIPALPLYLDSPMAGGATQVYRDHPEAYDEETRRLLERGDTPLDYPEQVIVRTVEQSRAVARARRPYMIVASNGMLTGGRIVGHLRELVDDPGATILFVGYQGEGTLGAHLQAGARTVKIDGQVRQVRCRIRSIGGFSAHADEAELLAWLAGFAAGRRPGDAGFPRRVYLVHGDPEAQAALLPKVRELGFDAVIPRWHETVDLG
ncbi:MAG: beta-lactamase domain protein, partial [Chloroflexi bacterium]|nr:beta-lactamase domain protein [Chloroflexota bacterium]